MNKLLLLIKTNLLNMFSISVIINSSNKKERNKHLRKFMLMIIGLVLVAYYIYTSANFSILGYIILNIPYILLGQYFCTASIVILFTNLFRIKGAFFDFRDYYLLMSLPIKKSIVLLSKLISLYLFNLIYIFVIMFPVLMVYTKYIDVDITFYILYLITMFLIPVLPMIISFIVGTVINYVTSFFKHKNLVNYIVNFGLVICTLLIYFKLNSMTILDMTNLGQLMVNRLQSVYPLIKLYLNVVRYNDFLSLVIFILISFGSIWIFSLIINKYYSKIRKSLLRNSLINNYKLDSFKINKPLFSLYKRELYRYFSSINYVLNTMIGCILLILFVVMLLVFDNTTLEQVLGITNLISTIKLYAPFILSLVCVISCTTHSSISLEGKNLWIIKNIPISYKKIFLSKIMVNLTILIPTILISSIILCVSLHVDLLLFIFMVIMPILYSIFTSCFGLIINLHYPDFNWENEVKVIKQSIPSFISVFVGMLIGIMPLMIDVNLSHNLYIFLVIMLMILIDVGLIIYLNKNGKKLFSKL